MVDALKMEVDALPHGIVSKVTQQDKRITPPALFDLVTLQKEANRFHGLTALQILTLTQGLRNRPNKLLKNRDIAFLNNDYHKQKLGGDCCIDRAIIA